MSEGGRVVASADTSAVGPGYHTFVGRTLERAGDAVGVDWTGEAAQAAAAPVLVAAGSVGGGSPRIRRPVPAPSTVAPLMDRPGVERAHLAWLGHLLGRAREARRQGVSGIDLGTRPGTTFRFEGALATPLGPRDDTWLEQAAGDARVAIDVGRGGLMRPTPATSSIARCACCGRTCAGASRSATRSARSSTRRCGCYGGHLPLDPSLAYPWREWHELIGLRDVDDPMARQIADRATRSAAAGSRSAIADDPVTVTHEAGRSRCPARSPNGARPTNGGAAKAAAA